MGRGHGTLDLKFGNDHEAAQDDPENVVVAYLNKNTIGEAHYNDENIEVLQDFQDGDLLEITEVYGVLLIHSIALDCSANDDRRLIDSGSHGLAVWTIPMLLVVFAWMPQCSFL